jgi:hypothetical protein
VEWSLLKYRSAVSKPRTTRVEPSTRSVKEDFLTNNGLMSAPQLP